jgi:membrane protease YdiL (CAAX protease family)
MNPMILRKLFHITAVLGLIGAAVVALLLPSDWDPDRESRHVETIKTHEDYSTNRLNPASPKSSLTTKCMLALFWLDPTRKVITMTRPTDSFTERLGHTALIGYVEGWQDGIKQAKAIDLPPDAIDEARRLRDMTIAAMVKRASLTNNGDGVDSGVTEEIEALRPMLGYSVDWMGPHAPMAMQTALISFTVVMGILCVFVATFMVIMQAFIRKMRCRLTDPLPTHTALVLGETFMLWMALYVIYVVTIPEIFDQLDDACTTSSDVIEGITVDIGLLILALAYPLVRNIPWPKIRTAIGLSGGQGVGREFLQGVVCFISESKLIFLLFIIMPFFYILDPLGEPTNPNLDLVKEENTTLLQLALLFISICILTPIVEEIVFRGFFFGYLRHTILPNMPLTSFSVSALVSSVVFGLIHPYGVMGNSFVILGGMFFCLFREMRGSLIAPMVAHAIFNSMGFFLNLDEIRLMAFVFS